MWYVQMLASPVIVQDSYKDRFLTSVALTQYERSQYQTLNLEGHGDSCIFLHWIFCTWSTSAMHYIPYNQFPGARMHPLRFSLEYSSHIERKQEKTTTLWLQHLCLRPSQMHFRYPCPTLPSRNLSQLHRPARRRFD